MEDITKYFIRPVKYKERLELELKVIQQNERGVDLTSYFTVLADITTWAKNNGIVKGPGRGSAAGSYVAYLLGITDIDPISFNLPFSRFLSNARINKGSMPDIDLDFPTSKRKELLDYVFEKYKEKAAHVAIFSSLKLKNSLLDVFRAMVTQPTELEIDNAKKSSDIQKMNQLHSKLRIQTEEFAFMRKSLDTLVPGASDNEIIHGYSDSDGIYHPGLLESNKMFADWTKKYPEIFEMTEKVLGLPRHIGTHAGGIVIAPMSLPEVVPVFKDNGVNVISYDKKIIGKHGLVKYDLLGVTSLDHIQTCLDLLKNKGINLDIYNLPENEKMWDVFLDGRCQGIFQWSTSGGARFAKKLKPRCFKDLSDGVALNRPGALDAIVTLPDGTEMTAADVYLKRKSGELPVSYLHPSLEPILKETLGVAFFQENIMQIMIDLFKYTEEEADDVRSKISDKDVKSFEKIKQDAQKLLIKGWKQSQIDELYSQILAFSRYGFNCIDGEQLIKTSLGAVPLKNISDSPLKYNVAYLDKDSIIKYENPIHGEFKGNKEILEVELEDGTLIRGTPDHKIFDGVSWIRLGDLTELSYILRHDI